LLRAESRAMLKQRSRTRPWILGPIALLVLALVGVCRLSRAQVSQTSDRNAVLTFVVFGDNRPGGASEAQPEVFQQICTEIGMLAPDFVIGTGDYIYGADDETTLRAQWADFFSVMHALQARTRVPFAPAAGNHDIRGSRLAEKIFKEYFKRLYFSFNRDGCHFVVLDSEIPGNAGRITGAQWEWLQADLRQHRSAALTFVTLHRPLFPVDGHIGSSMDVDPKRRDALHRLFVQEGVDVVFAGHEHVFNDNVKDGVRYVITGGAGARLYASPKEGGFHHYVVVQVRNGRYTMDVRTPSSA